MSNKRKSISLTTIFTLLISNALLIHLSIREIPENEKTLYLPFWINSYTNLSILLLALSFLTFLFFLYLNKDQPRTDGFPIVTTFIIFGIIATCLFIASSLWIQKTHLGTFRVNSTYYQFAKIYRYDDISSVLLGQCDNSGRMCEFHTIYRINTINRITEIELIRLNC